MLGQADDALKKALGQDRYDELMDKYEKYGEGQERLQKIFEDLARVTGDERLADAAKKIGEFSPDAIAGDLSKKVLPKILREDGDGDEEEAESPDGKETGPADPEGKTEPEPEEKDRKETEPEPETESDKPVEESPESPRSRPTMSQRPAMSRNPRRKRKTTTPKIPKTPTILNPRRRKKPRTPRKKIGRIQAAEGRRPPRTNPTYR
jgi:hypothetical protein